MRARQARLDSVNLDKPEIAYQVIAGAPFGTYIFLSPLSLKFLDNGRPSIPFYAEDPDTNARKLASETEVLREHLWFRISPRISHVSEEFALQDQAFWHPNAR